MTARFQDVITADPQAVALKQLAPTVQNQAAAMAFGDAFCLVAAFFLAAVGSIALIRKPRNAVTGGH